MGHPARTLLLVLTLGLLTTGCTRMVLEEACHDESGWTLILLPPALAIDGLILLGVAISEANDDAPDEPEYAPAPPESADDGDIARSWRKARRAVH